MKRYLYELNKRKDLLLYIVGSGLKAQHRNSFLGYFWWLLDPILGVLIYYFVVGIVFKRGGKDYILELTVGLAVWRWVSSSIIGGARSIVTQAGIITQVYLPKALFPVGSVLTQLVNFSFGLVAVVIFLLIFGMVPGVQVLWLPFIVVVQLLFLVALTLPLAYASVFVRDLDNVLDHVMRLWFYASPVVWQANTIPPRLSFILWANPMAHFLEAYRSVFIAHTSPNVLLLGGIGLVSLAVVAATTNFYSRYEHRLIKVL